MWPDAYTMYQSQKLTKAGSKNKVGLFIKHVIYCIIVFDLKPEQTEFVVEN